MDGIGTETLAKLASHTLVRAESSPHQDAVISVANWAARFYCVSILPVAYRKVPIFSSPCSSSKSNKLLNEDFCVEIFFYVTLLHLLSARKP